MIQMRFDQYYNESGYLLDNLKDILAVREERLMTVFIQQGPEILKDQLGIRNDHDWKLVFDRLVFSKDVVRRCVVNFMPFFKMMVTEHGPQVLRTIFAIEDSRYDKVYEQVFDLVGVSDGAIHDYVYKNGDELAARVTNGQAGALRQEMGLESSKYDHLWAELLEMMHSRVCAGIENETNLERGLDAFSLMMSAMREHRSLRSYAKMWEYSEKAE